MKRKRSQDAPRSRGVSLIGVAILLLAATGPAALLGQSVYSITNLSALGMSQVRGLNNLGEVAGGNGSQALLYRSGQMINLGTLVGTNTSIAVAINDNGQVVVRSPTTTDVRSRYAHVYLYSGGGMSDLGTPGDNPLPTAINNNGEIVGSFNGNYGQAAVIYSGGQWTNVLSPNVSYNHVAYGINGSGQIALNVLWGGYLFSAGQQTAVGFTVSRQGADSINDSGQIVGWTGEWYFDTNHHAFLYSGGATIDLGTLGGTWSEAYAINNGGQIVGRSTTATGATQPFIYSGGTMTELGSLISDLRVSSLAWDTTPGALKFVHTNSGSSFSSTPIAINDQAQILCSDGRLLTPVSAPSTCAQLFWAMGPSVSNKISDIFTQTIPVGPGGSSASVQVPAANLQNRPPNATHVVLVLNCDNQFPESNTNNNTSALNITQPDLLPASLAWSSQHGGLDYSYTVQPGTSARAATSADLFWATGTAASNRIGSSLSSQPIPAAFSGQSSNFTVSAWVFDSPPANASHVMLVVDLGNLVTESSEENNVMALAFPRPDLAPAYFRWAASGHDLEFSYTVQTGRTAIATTTAKLYWANGAAISNQMSSTPLFTANIPAGASGQSSNIIVSAANLQNPPPNATHVLLRLDPDNLVGEENETNNTAAINLALPDLFPRSFNWSATGGGLDFSYTVRTGFVATAASTAKIFWADGTTLSDVLSSTPIFTVNIPTGTSGTSPLVHVPAETFLTPANGTTKVLLVLDADNTVAEGDETNNTLAIDFEYEPTELSGRVLDAVSRSPLGGATVSLGQQSTTTSAAGEYVLSGVPVVVTNTLVVTKTGYSTNQTRIIVPPRMPKKVVPDIFLAPDGAFVITAIEPKYDGLFLQGVEFYNEYTAKVAWGDRTPGRVDFYVNDVLTHSLPTSGETAVASIDVGRFEGLRLGKNEVKAIAIDSGGNSSSPFEQVITTIPTPALLRPSIGLLAPWQFSGGKFTFEIQFPAKEVGKDAYTDLGRFGRFGEALGFGGSFAYTLSGGKWEANFGSANNGKWEKPLLHVYQSTLKSKAYGYGAGTATMAGIEVEDVAFKVMFTYEEKLWELPLSRIVPAAVWLDYVNWLVQIGGADMASIAKVNIYGRVDSEVSLNADAKNSPVKYKNTTFSLDLGARASYEPDFYVAKGELTLGGSLGGEFEINPKLTITEASFKVYGKVGLRVKNKVVINTSFVIVEGSTPISLLDASNLPAGWQVIPIVSEDPRGYLEVGPEVFVANLERGEVSGNKISPLEKFRLLGRSPVEGVRANTPKQQGYDPSDSTGHQADVTLVENVHDDASPALATRGAEVMLLYQSASRTTNSLDNTDIRWTRWDGTNWSAPEAIRTNSQAEFCPQVKFDGNGDALAVWERVADPNLTNEDLTVMLSQLEIVWSRWSRISGTWSEPVALSANNYLDHSPRLCGPMSNGDVLLVWTKNQANLLMGRASPSNDIAMWSEWHAGTESWSTPQALLDNLSYRLSDSLAGSSNCAVYAWATDTDGVLTNGVDQEVFFVVWTNGAWGTVQQLTSNNIPDRNVRAGVSSAGDSFLAWQSGTNLVFNQGLSGTNQLARPDTQSAGFTDYAFTIGLSNNLILIWQEMSTNGYDPHFMVYDPVADTWGKEDLLLDDLARESSFATAWDSAGNLVVAYEKVQVIYTNKTVTLTNGETLVIPNVPEAGRVDLAVTKRALIKDLALAAGDFTVEGANYLPGDQLTLAAAVRNVGNLAVSNVVVDFFSGNPAAGGVLVASGNLAGWLAAATNAVVSANWIVSEPATNYTLYAVANRTGLAGEFDPSNNIASVKIGGTDLAVTLVRKTVETNGAMRIVAQVQNLGAPAATNCTLTFRVAGSTNALPLATVAVPSLRPGRTAELALQLPPGTHAPGESLYTLTVDEAHLNSDVDTNNNQTSFAVVLWLDSDGDGMPDHWEIANGLNPFDPLDALADTDHDGLSNLDEYRQGKNPKLFDNLRVVTSQRLPNGQCQLTAFVEPGRNYILEASTNLVVWESILAFTATNSPVTLLDSSAHAPPRRFYRLHLSVDQPPLIRRQPANATNHIGSLASLTVNAEGSAPLRYHWRKGGIMLSDGGNLSGTTNKEFFITNVSPANAGPYDVVVFNVYGSVTSQVATLTVTTNNLMTGLLAYFPFDGDALDASGNGRDGIVQGAILATNRLGSAGSAYVFNGGNSIRVDSLDPDIYTNGFSFGAWVRPDAYSGVLGWTYDAGWGATYLAAGGSTVAFRIGTGSSATDHGVSASVPLGGWSHLIVTHHPTNDALYLNGVLIGQWPSYPMQGNVSTFLIGSSYAGNFVGAIDEVVVYGRTLSSNDVQTLYIGGLLQPKPPLITLQPRNQTNAVGTTANFAVTATGTAPLRYQWRSNSVPLAWATASSYSIPNVQAADAAGYDVVVTNMAGSVTSAVAILTVTVTLPVTNRIAAAALTNGGFVLQVNGAPISTWYVLRAPALSGPWTAIGTVTMSGAGTGMFMDTNPPSAQAFYRLSSILPQPPVITQQPQSLISVVGSTAGFTVTASGTAPLSYQWRSNSVPLVGATASSYSIPVVQTAHAASYDVVVTNVAGSLTSQVASLTVIQTSVERITNVLATATSELSSYDRLAQYLVDGTFTPAGALVNGNGVWESAGIGFGATNDYAPMVMFDFGGVYAVSEMRLWNFPEGQVAIKRLMVETSLDGANHTPIVDIDGINQSGGTTNALVLGGVRYVRLRMLENWGGTVYPVTPGQPPGGFAGFAGLHEVAFYGTLQSSAVPPVIAAQPQSRTNVAGTTAGFSVTATGTAPLSYQWRSNGVPLAGAMASSYSIPNVQAADAAGYDVVITNKHGAVTSELAYLTVTIPNTCTNWDFVFGYRHVNDAGADGPLVETVAVRKYSEWQFPPITYWGPSANSTEGRLVYQFSLPFASARLWLKARSWAWDYGVGFGRGCAALEASRDGVNWVSLRNSLEPRQWGVSWTYDELLPSELTGTSNVWVRIRLVVEDSDNDLYTNAQTGRSTSVATETVFEFRAAACSNGNPPMDAPVITQQPQPITSLIGGVASFAVSATGTAPLSYQWRSNTVPLAGATNSGYSIPNVQVAHAASYDVVVSNGAGSVTSQIAVLTVLMNTLRTDLLAYLPIEDAAQDESGNGRHGVVNGAVLTTNRLGQANSAYSFDGSSYIQINNLDPDTYPEGFSFGAWVKPVALGGGWFYWHYNAGWGSTFLMNSNSLHFRIGTGSPATDHEHAAVALPLNEWSHVLVSHSPTNDCLFVNGTLVGEWPSFPMARNVDYLRIGQGYDFSGFQGAVDEIVVFSRSLSLSDVRLIYKVGLTAPNVLLDSVSVSASQVTIVLAGTIPTSWSVERTVSPTGAWTNIGSVVIDGSGRGFFQDTNPPATSRFYRAVRP